MSHKEQLQKVKEYFKSQNPDLEAFMDNSLANLPNFSNLIDIDLGVNALVDAIMHSKTIGLYGDYDADGTTSLAVFYYFLKSLGVTPKTYQPSRFVEGYGLHSSIVERAKSEGVELLITFDCGITDYSSAQKAKDIGLPLIITDHHSTGELELPYAIAVINPNRKDQPESDLKKLAGCGVAFAFAVEVRKKLSLVKQEELPSLYPLLQFVAIGTIGDMVPLCPMNAKFVRHGLAQFRTSTFPAIKAFLSSLGDSNLDSSFIGFSIAPMINAEGRLDTPEKSLRLLISDDFKEAKNLFDEMRVRNEERKKIQRTAEIIADNKIKKHKLETDKVIVIYHDKIHQGVVGLVASYVVKNYKRPCIVLTDDIKNSEVLKGSARSYGDFDLYSFLKSLNFNFINFGGHKKAGGMSFNKSELSSFLSIISQSSSNLEILPPVDTTLELPPELVDLNLVSIIESFGPFGEGNPRPCITTTVEVSGHKILKGDHVKFNLRNIKGSLIFFNFLRNKDAHIPNGTLKISGSPTINLYMGNSSLSIIGASLEVLKKGPESNRQDSIPFLTPDSVEF